MSLPWRGVVRVRLCDPTARTAAGQVPLSVAFSRQECVNGLLFPPSGQSSGSRDPTASAASPKPCQVNSWLLHRLGSPAEGKRELMESQPIYLTLNSALQTTFLRTKQFHVANEQVWPFRPSTIRKQDSLVSDWPPSGHSNTEGQEVPEILRYTPLYTCSPSLSRFPEKVPILRSDSLTGAVHCYQISTLNACPASKPRNFYEPKFWVQYTSNYYTAYTFATS